MNVKNSLIGIIDLYKRATIKVFTKLGLVFSAVLIVVFLSFYIFNYNTNVSEGPVPVFHFDPLGIIFSLLSAFVMMALWWMIGTRYAPKIGELLTEKKISNLLLTKGDMHYFEKVDEENLRITPINVISKFINLLLAWLAVTAFILGFLLPLFSGSTSNAKLYSFFTAEFGSGSLIDYILKIIIVFVLAPLLMSITIPIPWMLIDAHLKSYNTNTKTNAFVGRAIQTKLSPLFAIGGLITLIVQNISVDTIILIVIFAIAILAFPTIIMVTLYSMLFQVKYYESFLRKIPVPFGTTSVQMEVKFQKQSDNADEQGDELPADESSPESI